MSEFENVFKGLKTIYLEETRQRAAAMAYLLGHLEREPEHLSREADDALGALVVQFHGLAGTGASYGFEELSLLGRMGEFDTATRHRLGGACTAEELRTWKALIDQIEAAASFSLPAIFPIGIFGQGDAADFAGAPA